MRSATTGSTARILGGTVLALLLAAPLWADVFIIPLDQQIDIGLGNAITPDTQTLAGLDRLTFEDDGGVGFARFRLVEDNGMGGYYFGPTIDLVRAGIGPLDLSAPGASISFEARYYQDRASNTNPYGDAPVFTQVHNEAGDFAGTQATYWSGYDWMPVQFNPATYGNWYTGNPALDLTRVTSISFWGTDWAGNGDDYVDFRNLQIVGARSVVPEPATGLMLAMGGGLVAAFRLRKRRS